MTTSIISFFVNRERIHALFSEMLMSTSEKQIMLVHALGGMGKSWLVAKLKHECSIQSPPVLYTSLDFKDGQAHDYLSIIRRVRDDLGAAHFNYLTQTINAGTDIHVNLQITGSGTGGVNITQSEVRIGGDVAGRDIIKDNFFNVQVDSEAVRREIEARITEAFFSDLCSLLGKTTGVFFIDTYEKAPEATRLWIENHLLYQIREVRLPRAVVIITGREVPQFDLD